jgi:hypothetical protein
MVKTYLRYEQSHSFGVISSSGGNVVFDRTGKLALTASLEDVCVWNLKQAALVHTLKGDKVEVWGWSMLGKNWKRFAELGYCFSCLPCRSHVCAQAPTGSTWQWATMTDV